jgi:hypothetical protein
MFTVTCWRAGSAITYIPKAVRLEAAKEELRDLYGKRQQTV